MTAQDQRWLHRSWPDGMVVFDRQTGDTHALDALTSELLSLPDLARYDSRQAAQVLADRWGLPPESLHQRIEEALTQLRRIELI
ncbi:HPr-rel-A system PqqD family peptide chaperone [Niveibacterium sp. SC-1]|uniref:HPr-rel-A system PqqD family peptide chaperone n=1 Tax=Niveibacterium sp. SC-1 TaxID=3135646 RepID=UPI00311EFE38